MNLPTEVNRLTKTVSFDVRTRGATCWRCTGSKGSA